ncbi:MAG: hypothetical protein IJ766_07195 [Clostridia bacterium]|nr:hypothetical protein [Clostridia bacterium]
MNKHSSTFEQYCCVMEKNVIMEETHFHNGTKHVHCANHLLCAMNGGCKNNIIKKQLASEDSERGIRNAELQC